MNDVKINELAGFIWSVADILRGDYKQADYGKVILPFTVLRRLDCVLEPTKKDVMNFINDPRNRNFKSNDLLINKITNLKFHNSSRFTFASLYGQEPKHLAANLNHYINGFSKNALEIIEYFKFAEQIDVLDQAGLLFMVFKRFNEIDLHPQTISNTQMGYIFEELIRKFAELSNETAGEHFTPREVIRLMVDLLFNEDSHSLTTPGVIKTIYDPACGTGGMLSIAEEYMKELNPESLPVVFGQELNPESYAICKADMLIKGQDVDNLKFGNSFSNDGLPGNKFDYMLSNPPFGVEWKKVEGFIRNEHETEGYNGRFGPGLPRISDGSFLFLLHMISKMKQNTETSRIAIVFNGSPLFSGGAGSGESNIRRWIIENDMLEAIVALPDQLFYNTGISTYLWILTSQKSPRRKGKIQFVNAVSFYEKMSRSLGNKRNEISTEQIHQIARIYGDFETGPHCKIFLNEEFGYRRVTVDRPLRLNFQVNAERIERVKQETAFIALARTKKKDEAAEEEIKAGEAFQQQLLTVLNQMSSDMIYKNRPEFEQVLDKAFEDAGLSIKAPLRKAILNALSDRDETADICLDSRGNPEPDAELRDYENVPLTEDVQAYFEREVLPHVPDAWYNPESMVTGYEINFTRYFYEYKPLRSLEDITAELLALEKETEGLLEEVIRG